MFRICATLLFCIGMIQSSSIRTLDRQKRQTYSNDLAVTRTVKKDGTDYKTCDDLASIEAYNENAIKDDLMGKHREVRLEYNAEVEARGCQDVTISTINLEWDTDLAKLAQLWANECCYGHGYYQTQCGDNDDVTRYEQNVMFETQSWNNAVTMFQFMTESIVTNEKGFMDLCERTCKSGMECGHYRRLTNRNLSKMGCAYTDPEHKCTTMRYQDKSANGIVEYPGYVLPAYAMYVCIYQ